MDLLAVNGVRYASYLDRPPNLLTEELYITRSARLRTWSPTAAEYVNRSTQAGAESERGVEFRNHCNSDVAIPLASNPSPINEPNEGLDMKRRADGGHCLYLLREAQPRLYDLRLTHKTP